MDLDLKNLDPNAIGDWPLPIKAALILLICICVAGGWIYIDTVPQLEGLDKVEKEELSLRSEFETKQARAANLERYRQQVEEMKQSLGAMLRQLPNKTEVASLLVDVSQTGLGAGLEFELFDPQPQVNKEFYAELPITIRVKGGYHQFGEFVSGLAALPRIVTIHDIRIEKANKETGLLSMSAIAKTYRYVEEETEAK